ncbi:hypothetical protein ANN_01962 [Periplaneta americana]|uniref:Uncharacterized protein n=1 Tax=Periplaneta americana TaxID=6978 RepID=A0ABQ8TUX6_PERAM|nr:hypothetical protein ANN_01962 [Periplaneta americana]
MERRFQRQPLLQEEYCKFMTDYEQLGHMRKIDIKEEEEDKESCYLPHHATLRKCTPKSRCIQKTQVYTQPEEQVRVYELTTVTYGTSSAPFQATRSLQMLAEVSRRYPLASRTLQRDFYVDDLLSGCSNLQTTLTTQSQLTEVLQSAGFHLRKWSSNHPSLLRQCLQKTEKQNYHTLSMKWMELRPWDFFGIQVQTSFSYVCSGSTMTKRQVASTIASIFDPLGLISPVVIKRKIFL